MRKWGDVPFFQNTLSLLSLAFCLQKVAQSSGSRHLHRLLVKGCIVPEGAHVINEEGRPPTSTHRTLGCLNRCRGLVDFSRPLTSGNLGLNAGQQIFIIDRLHNELSGHGIDFLNERMSSNE